MSIMGNVGRGMIGATGPQRGMQGAAMGQTNPQQMMQQKMSPMMKGPMGPSRPPMMGGNPNMWMQRNGGMGMPNRMPTPYGQPPMRGPMQGGMNMPMGPFGRFGQRGPMTGQPGGYDGSGINPGGGMHTMEYRSPQQEQERLQRTQQMWQQLNQGMGSRGLSPSAQGFLDPSRYGGQSMPGVMY